MKPTEAQAFRIHGYEIYPDDGVVNGPDGTFVVPADALSTLVRLARRPGHALDVAALSGLDAPGDDHRDAVRAQVRLLRAHLGGDADSNRLIEAVGDDRYRLIAPVLPVDHPNPSERHDPGDRRGRRSGDTVGGEGWLNQLQEKRVFRAIASYAVAAWLLLQIVDVVAGALPVPNWTMTAATIAVACGFPLVAVIAWTFQLTPEGLVLDIGNGPRSKDGGRRLKRNFDLVVIAILIGLVVFLSWGRVFATAAPDSRFTLAVLPFTNLSGDPEDDYLGDGLADDLRARLFDVPQLLVAAGRSSRALAAQPLDIREIGRRLTVDHVLEGSIRRADDQLRVTVQLIDVETGFNRWNKAYDTSVDDVLDLENDIALVVASELEILLSRELRSILADGPTEDTEAHALYLQARDYFIRPRTEDNLAQAQRLYAQAIDVDPRFALAHAGLCRTLIERYRQSGDTQFVARAEQDCLRALALDEETSDAHTALGELYLATGRVADAEQEFESAIRLNDRAIGAQTGLADAYARQGRVDEAEAQYQQAIGLLPGNWDGFSDYALFLMQQGRFEEAIDNYQRVVDLTPDNANALNNIGTAWYFLGEFDKAAEYFSRSLKIDPNRAAYSNTGTMYYYAGDYERALKMFLKAAGEAESDYRLWGNVADAQRFVAATNDTAHKYYERAIALAKSELQLDPGNADALLNIGWYHVNLGDAAEARTYLSRAQDIGGLSVEQHYTEALILAVLDDRAAASAALQVALGDGFPRAVVDATPELQSAKLTNE